MESVQSEPSPVATFSSLGISGVLADSIKGLGWTHPTEIQTRAIPEALQGRDIIGLAETGNKRVYL